MGIVNRISARHRISLGLAGMVVGSLLIASALGFFPNEQKEILKGRSKLCETLAISGTAMASSGQFATLTATLESIVNRDEDVLSIGLRTEQDGLLATAGLHERNWVAELENNVQQMRVPVYRNGEQWGHLEICFRSTGGLLGLNYWAPAWLLVFIVPACLLQFHFYLGKTLKQLEPSDRVPQHVQDALDTLSVGLLLMDQSNRILYGNTEFASSVGADANQLVGADASSLNWKSPDDQEQGLPWIETGKSGQAVSDQILQLDVNGRLRTFSINCSSVGKGMLATFDDITLLEEARQSAQQASESKSAFLANMSHEIRTPLNAVLGFTDVLRRGLVTDAEESIDHLNMIHRSGKHLLELINDILDLSKIEAGKMDVETIEVHPDQIIADTASVLGVRAREKGLELKLEFNSAVPRTIQSDPTRLKQVITNLIGNAIKFTSEGSVTISTRVIADDSPKLRIDIVDTGIGMTPEQAERIFDSFSQADETTTRKFGGTGLGLSISRRLTEALGGVLTVDSEDGVGSTFTITLPLDPASLDDLQTPDEILASAKGGSIEQGSDELVRLPAKPVLVVDDGEANRRLIELVLERAGAVVTSVANGLEAIEMLEQKNFELIFMDMQMPVMDGYSATRRIRSAGLTTPIVALTGNAMKGDREKCIEAGCNDFLTKPVNIDELLMRTVHFIGQKPGDQESNAGGGEPIIEHAGVDKPASVRSAIEQPTDAVRPAPICSTLPMDDEDFRAIVEDFVGRLDDRFLFIERAIAKGDLETVQSEAHWLKGAGGTVGFPAFTEPAGALERAARLGELEQATEILATICDIRSRLAVPQADSKAKDDKDASGFPTTADDRDDRTPIHCTLPLDDPEYCAIVIDFVERFDQRLAVMQRLCAEGRLDELRDPAHWLKGSGGTVGYTALSKPAAALELAVRRNSREDADRAMAAILAIRDRLVVPTPESA